MRSTQQLTIRDSTNTVIPGITGFTMRMDEGATPYLTASLSMKIPPAAVLARLDHRLAARVTVVANRQVDRVTQSSRSVQLRVTDTVINHLAGTLELTLANAEVALDYAPAEDLDLNTYYGSVREIVRRVIDRATGIYPTMDVSPDAAYLTAFSSRNLVPVSNFEDPLTRWVGNNTSLAIATGYARSGSNSLRISLANNGAASTAQLDPGLSAGKTYRLAVWAASPAGNVLQAGLTVISIENNVETIVAASPFLPLTAAPQERSITFTMPENARSSFIRVSAMGAASNPATAIHIDAVSLFESPFVDRDGVPIPYFDGDTFDDQTYQYTWDGLRGQSTSTRTPRVERRPETLIWRAGVSARDFLTPILQAVRLRLFQSPDARWTLADPTYQASGLLRFDHQTNLYDATDTNGLNAKHPDGTPLWADAVQLVYRWRDDEGNDQERADTAAPVGYTRLYREVIDGTPFPGVGRAEYLRQRFGLRARQMSIDARFDLSVTPSQQVTISAPGTPLQTGIVDSVVWDFTNDRMTVECKALVDTPTTSWNQLALGLRWSDSPLGASWASETA